jgi:hypothetical protein
MVAGIGGSTNGRRFIEDAKELLGLCASGRLYAVEA